MRFAALCLALSLPMAAIAAPHGLDPDNQLLAAQRISPLPVNAQSAPPAPAPRTPLYVATAVELFVDSDSSGVWDQSRSQQWIWRARIKATDAASLGVTLAKSPSLANAEIHVYSLDGLRQHQLMDLGDSFRSPLVAGNELVLEVALPLGSDKIRIEVPRVDYGFVDPARSEGYQKSGPCNIDVVCPDGDPWRDEVRSVARYTASDGAGTYFCTGTLLANTSQDSRPIFLTANHCISSEAQANSMTFYWNYETSTCGGSPDGQLNQFQSGASLLATRQETDFALVELHAKPNSSFNVHYAGWDATGTTPIETTAIHHPAGDEKRISFDNDPPTSTFYGSNTVSSSGTHWRIIDWDRGTTEGGSSGSALWNESRHVVGQLEGGGAACENDLSDWYGKLSASWEESTESPCTSLEAHLDPMGARVPTVLDGYDPDSASHDSTLGLTDSCFRATSEEEASGGSGGGSGALLWFALLPLLGLAARRRRR